MAGDVTVRGGGWHVKDVRRREIAPTTLPTMSDTGEIDLRRFFRILWRGKWILLLTMVATMGATTYWLLQVTPRYTADVLIVLEPRPSSIVKVEEAVHDVSSDTTRVNTEAAILQSRYLAARVISHLGLEDDPEFLEEASDVAAEPSSGSHVAGVSTAGAEVSSASPHGDAGASNSKFLTKLNPGAVLTSVSAALESARSFLTSAWAGEANRKGQGIADAMRDDQNTSLLLEKVGERQSVALLNQFLKRLSVEPEDQSRLISISFTSVDPKKAALIANKLADEYMQEPAGDQVRRRSARRGMARSATGGAWRDRHVVGTKRPATARRIRKRRPQYRIPTPGGAHQSVGRRPGCVSGSRGALPAGAQQCWTAMATWTHYPQSSGPPDPRASRQTHPSSAHSCPNCRRSTARGIPRSSRCGPRLPGSSGA